MSENPDTAELAAALQDPDYRRAWEQGAELARKAAAHDEVLARAEEAESYMDQVCDLYDLWEVANNKRKARLQEGVAKLKGIFNQIESGVAELQAENDAFSERVERARRIAATHTKDHPTPRPGTCTACALIAALELDRS